MPSKSLRVWFFCFIWTFSIVTGFAVLWSYENAPGPSGLPTGQWPIGTQIRLDPGRQTLVMFAHPQCSCTAASIEELAKLMTKFQGRLSAYIVFEGQKEFGDSWTTNSRNWAKASRIPGLIVRKDDSGDEARRFQIKTSGHALLYSSDGKLLFSGGITDARGHEGDNAGEDALASLISSGAAERRSTFVFGCLLATPQSRRS